MPGRRTEAKEIAAIKGKTCEVYQVSSFAEFAALALARNFARKQRRLDAQRVLRAYLRKHQGTARIRAALLAVS